MNTCGDSPEDMSRAYAAMQSEDVQKSVAALAEAINILRERLEDVEEDVELLLKENSYRRKIR